MGAGVDLLRAMMSRFRTKRSLHPRWTTGGVLTLLGAASDATAGVLKGRATSGERGRSAVDAANYLVLVWMHCFGWRLYLGGSQYGPEAGVGIFGLVYLAAVGGLRAIPPIGEVPRELERLARVVGGRGAEAEVERTAVSCVAALAEVYRLSREEDHPVVSESVRAVLEHVFRCADCRERYGGEGLEVALELLRPGGRDEIGASRGELPGRGC